MNGEDSTTNVVLINKPCYHLVKSSIHLIVASDVRNLLAFMGNN